MINALFAALAADLAAEGIPAPLSRRFTLAAVWCDLARLAGEAPPAHVRRAAGEADTVATIGAARRLPTETAGRA